MIRSSALTDIYHIKLPGSRQLTVSDESHGSIIHERRQPSNQDHKAISRRCELAAAKQRRQLSPRSPPTPSGTVAYWCASPHPVRACHLGQYSLGVKENCQEVGAVADGWVAGMLLRLIRLL
jgi:hypothetical protein